MSKPDPFDQAYWSVCLADFPTHQDQLKSLLPTARGYFAKGDMHRLNRVFVEFLEGAGAWPRYDTYLAEWQRPDPRIPELDEDGEVSGADFREASELLAHRIVMTINGQRKRAEALASVDVFRWWKFIAVGDSRTPADCLKHNGNVYLHDSMFWQRKQIPCEKLFCRCRMLRQMDKK